jgi:hypothetical protein
MRLEGWAARPMVRDARKSALLTMRFVAYGFLTFTNSQDEVSDTFTSSHRIQCPLDFLNAKVRVEPYGKSQ